MNLRIKICGLRDPENIKKIAGIKPDMMGFIFYPGSPRYAGETLKPENLTYLPEQIKRVGVFVNSDPGRIKLTIRQYALDLVQLHGDETPETCQLLNETGISVIKAFNIKDREDFRLFDKYIKCTKYFLFDASTSEYGGSGRKFEWELLDNYDLGHPFILSGGIAPGDDSNIKKITNPSFFGIDINSRFEVRPGLKDVEKLKLFIAGIRN
jgi:phosphoribosylanthranilate isomerase